MYYRLKEPWTFRGWKKTPYAIRAEYGAKRHERPFFADKELFMELLSFNGEEDVDPSALSPKGQQILREFLASDMMEQSDSPMEPLKSWQRYHVFPSRYIESIHWSVTGKCNFRCRHCLVSAPKAHHPQLPLEDCLHIVEEIARCGINCVDITGGEPLVRPDLEKIVEALSGYGIDIGVFYTNASLLTKDVLDMFTRHGQHPSFQLSFDGLGHHDWLRGVPGAEKQADEAFRLLKEQGFSVSAAMCIHKGNRDCLRDTVNYLASLGVESLKVNSPQTLGVWKEYADEHALSEDEVWEIYKQYISDYFEDGMPMGIELDGYFGCKKGKTEYRSAYVKRHPSGDAYNKYPYCESLRYHAFIGPDGHLVPCMGFSDTALNDKFPSVLEHHLSELSLNSFYQDVANTRVSDYLSHNPECVKCEYLPSCMGGCMLQDITDEGDYLVPDKRACYFHRNIGEKAVREVADAAIKAYCEV